MKKIQMELILNKETERIFHILRSFEENPMLSADALEQVSSTSKKTISKTIQTIQHLFSDSVLLKGKPSYYNFTILNLTLYLETKRELLNNEPLYLIIEGVFHKRLKNIADWGDALYISESTILRYLDKLKKVLSYFNLDFSIEPVNFIGDEVNIRKFFLTMYYEADLTPHTVLPSSELNIVLTELVERSSTKLNSDITIANFSYLLYITMERSKGNNHINLNHSLNDSLVCKKDFSFFLEINKALKDTFNYSLSKEELMYVYFVCISIRSIDNLETERDFFYHYGPTVEINKLALSYFNNNDSTITYSDEEVIFFKSFFTAIYLRNLISPVYNKNIDDANLFVKKRFSKQYKENELFFTKLLKNNNTFTFHEDIFISFTIYMHSVRSQYQIDAKNIVFLIEGNHYINVYTKSFLLKYLNKNHNLFFPNFNELSPNYLARHQIDFVVTNSIEFYQPIIGNANFIIGDALPNGNDLNRLLDNIEPHVRHIFKINNR